MKKVKNNKPQNFTKLTHKGGISLIVLVVTIIVILILAAAVILTINNNNPIAEANKARYESDVSNMQAVFTNAVAKVMTHNRATVSIKSGAINTETEGVKEITGEVSYTVTNAMNSEYSSGTIVFDKGINTDTIFYTGKLLPIYEAGKTIWYVDSEGNILLEVGDIVYGQGDLKSVLPYKGLTITADTEGVIYTDADGNVKALSEEVADGDIIQYGDYEYRYNQYYEYFDNLEDCYFYWILDSNQNGWGVRVLDDTKSEYSEICGNILGKNVVNLNRTFQACTSLVKAPKIPNNVNSINYAFMSCESLVELEDIPSSVTSVEAAFIYCTSLSKAPNILGNITNMYQTFLGCTSLVEVQEIPNTVINMDGAFTDCSSLLKAPKISNGVNSLSHTFHGCTSLVEVQEIPNTVTNMYGTFADCTSLVEIPKVSNNVTNMYQTFSNCTSLVKAPKIPGTVTNMNRTFYGCTSLTGDVIVNANPTSYELCFQSTILPITLKGTSTDQTKLNLAGTANNNNVTY